MATHSATATGAPRRDDRRADEAPWRHRLQLVLRYVLGIAFVYYATTKVADTQLTGEPSTYDTPMSALTGFELTWAYYGYADIWRYIIGAGELTAALLLFWPRTARLGYLLSLLLLSQIVPMDVIYGIGQGTYAAIFLLLVALALAALDLRAVRAFVTAAWPAHEVPGATRRWSRVKYLAVPLIVLGILGSWFVLSRPSAHRSELFGSWQFRDTAGPVRLYVNRGDQCFVKFDTRVDINPRPAPCTLDEASRTLTLRTVEDPAEKGRYSFAFTGSYGLDAGGAVLTLTPEGGAAKAQVLDRAPSRYDQERTFDFFERGERATP